MHGVLYRDHTPEPMCSIFDDYEACNKGWPEPYELLLRPTDVILENGQVIRPRVTSIHGTSPTGRFTDTASNAR